MYMTEVHSIGCLILHNINARVCVCKLDGKQFTTLNIRLPGDRHRWMPESVVWLCWHAVTGLLRQQLIQRQFTTFIQRSCHLWTQVCTSLADMRSCFVWLNILHMIINWVYLTYFDNFAHICQWKSKSINSEDKFKLVLLTFWVVVAGAGVIALVLVNILVAVSITSTRRNCVLSCLLVAFVSWFGAQYLNNGWR